MMETAFLHTEEVRLRAVEPEDLGLLDRMEMMNLCGSMEM